MSRQHSGKKSQTPPSGDLVIKRARLKQQINRYHNESLLLSLINYLLVENGESEG